MPSPRSLSAPRRRLLWLSAALALGLIALGLRSLVQASHATQLREAYLDELLQQTPKTSLDGAAQALLGGRLAQVNRFDEAAARLERAAQAGERDSLIWRSWAACLVAADRRDEALAVLAQAQKGGARDTADIDATLKRTEKLPQGANALLVARTICPEGPAAVAVAYSRGSYLNGFYDGRASRDLPRSGFAFREALARQKPDDAGAQTLWAEALRRNGRLREAEQAALKAVQLDPKSLETRLAYADVLLAGGASVKAAREYQKLLAEKPDWLPAVIGLGRAATEKKLPRLALENLEKASKRAPENVEVWIALGKAYFYQGLRYDLSLSAFQRAAGLAPERTDFFTPMSDSLRATYKFAEAEALLRRRLQDIPRDAQAQYMLANLLTTQQETPARTIEAEKRLRTSLALEPGVPSVQQTLAQLLLDKPEASSAAEAGVLLVSVLQAKPREIGAMRLLAQAYRKIGKPAKATEVLATAAEVAKIDNEVRRLVEQELIKPADIGIHQRLSSLYKVTGESDKAMQEDAMIQMLKTNPERAARGLKALMDATMRESAAGPSPAPKTP